MNDHIVAVSPAPKETIVGTVVLHQSNQIRGNEKKEKICICCPGFASHVYQITFDLPDYESGCFPTHFGKNLDLWLQSRFSFKEMEGRRIRITAELIEEHGEG